MARHEAEPTVVQRGVPSARRRRRHGQGVHEPTIHEALERHHPQDSAVVPPHGARDLHVRGQRPTPAQVAAEAAQACVAGGVVVEIGTHEQGATAPEEGVGEGLVGIRARHGDAALAHGIGRAGIGPAKQAQAERRPEPEGRPHARFPREPPERVHIVAIGRDDAGAGVPVHHPSPSAEPGPEHGPPPLDRGRDPGARLDRARVVPQPAIEVAQVRGRHPQHVEPDVGVGAEAKMPPQRTVHGEGDPCTAFHRPGGEARLGARCQVTDRVAPAAGEADPLGGTSARPHRTEQEAAVVAAEIVRALAHAQRDAAEIVPPRHRHPGAHQPVTPGGLPGRVVEAMLHRPTPRAEPRLPVVQHIVVVRPQARVEHETARLPYGREFHPLFRGLARSTRVQRVAVADLHRHPAVASPPDRDGRAPAAVREPAPLDALEFVVDQGRSVEPLAEQPLQVLPGHLLRHLPEGVLAYVLQLPAREVGAQDDAHRVVPHHVAQLLVEQLRLGVDHLAVDEEVPVALAHHRDGLAPAVEVEEQHLRLEVGVLPLARVGLEEPAFLEVREPLVEPPLAPLVVGELAHQVLVAGLVHDQAERRAAVHDHHRELGAAALDAVHVGELWPLICPEQ